MFNLATTKSFLTCLLLSLAVGSQAVLAESSVWKVSKGSDYFYLGGTLHLLSKDDHPLPEEYEQAYQDVGTLIFETNLAAMESMAFQNKFMSAMVYRDQRTLESTLKPGTYRSLLRYMKSRQMPIAQFGKFQPWGVALMISSLEYQRLGMMPQYGVDQFFNEKALKDQKAIKALESPEQQLGFLSSMANVDPNMTINYTLRELKRLPGMLNEITTEWRSGDMDKFAKHAYVQDMKNLFPQVYDTILVKRNNNWMKLLPKLIGNDEKEFVLVGTMHMVGKEGLLSQLENQGFKIEQL